MKKALLILFLFTCTINSKTQSLAPPGAQWSYSLRSNFNHTVEPFTIQMSSDTLVFGRIARFTSIINPRNPFPCPAGLEYGYFSESNDSVYIYEDNRWQMLVNFNAQPGDTSSILISVNNSNGTQTAYRRLYIQVDSIKTITINSVQLKSVYLKQLNSAMLSTYTFHNGWYTQRLGANYGLIPWVNAGCAYGNYYLAEMRCYADPQLGNIQYSTYPCNAIITAIKESQGYREMNIHPNPVKEKMNVELTNQTLNIQSVQVFNLLGQRQPIGPIESQQNKMVLQLSGLKPGIYLLQIKTAEGTVVKKFVKE